MLKDKYSKAVITGAGSGIGKAFTDMLLKEGVEVWGTSRNAKSLTKADKFHPCELDLTDRDSVSKFESLLENELADADLLINNAGNGVFGSFENVPEEEIERQLDTMLIGPIRLCRKAFGNMKKKGSGVIVNVSSLASEYPLPYFSLYNAAKGGLSSFSRSLELEAHRSGVTIIDFQPGDYRTEFNKKTDKYADDSEILSNAWKSLEEHLEDAPDPEHAAENLKRALEDPQSGVCRSGDIFQANIGPFLSRFVPRSWTQLFLKLYYKL